MATCYCLCLYCSLACLLLQTAVGGCNMNLKLAVNRVAAGLFGVSTFISSCETALCLHTTAVQLYCLAVSSSTNVPPAPYSSSRLFHRGYCSYLTLHRSVTSADAPDACTVRLLQCSGAYYVPVIESMHVAAVRPFFQV